MGNLIASLDFHVTIPHLSINNGAETAETNFDEFKGKDCVFVADLLQTKGLHKLCSVFKYDLYL